MGGSEKDAGGGRWQPTVPAWLGEPTYILLVIIMKSNV